MIQPLPMRVRSQAGFTVMEVLVSLAVIGIAVSVFISLFRLSLTLLENSRGERIAAHVAEEQLTLLLARPVTDGLDWAGFWQAPVGEPYRLSTFKPAETPAAMPTERPAYAQTKNDYEGCAWEAYARLPEGGAAYVEVSIEVSWAMSGRERRFILTSCVPRGRVEDRA